MREDQIKKEEVSEVKIFSVPFASEDIKENITINTNTNYQLSKEEIINQGIKFHLEGNILEATKYYKYFINQGFKNHIVFSNYGIILKNLGHLKEAELSTRKAIELNPGFADAHSNLGTILNELGKLQEADLSYRRAVKLNPNDANAHYNIGNNLIDFNKLKEAEVSTRKAIELNPDLAKAHSNLGLILRDLDNLKEAEASTRKAIELNPDLAEAHLNLGIILRGLDNLKEAELSTRKAIELNPDYATAHSNLGSILTDLGRLEEAKEAYQRSIDADPKGIHYIPNLIYILLTFCMSDEIEKYIPSLNQIGIVGKAINPFPLMYVEDNPENHLKRSIRFCNQNFKVKSMPINLDVKEKINIGYFSADFNNHPVMHMIFSIFKLHNKDKFNIYLYYFGNKEDDYTQKIKEVGCNFKNINKLNDLEAVDLARKDQLDIGVDLMGFTKNNRMRIFSYRIAPIQINYLGFPGTTGCKEIDYIIGDKIIIPDEFRKNYLEKVIYMPQCYMPYNDETEISNKNFSREYFDLPHNAFVLAAFHDTRKITIREFNSWSRILSQIKHAVLWIRNTNDITKKNILYQFKKRGIEAEKIRFSKFILSREDHLSRHLCADLFIDTFNYNGHSTTIDSLWAGLPVVTLMGQSFSSRVSGSILSALDLTNLIANDISQYEQIIISLSRDKDKLSEINSLIRQAKIDNVLFNSSNTTIALENIYLDLINK